MDQVRENKYTLLPPLFSSSSSFSSPSFPPRTRRPAHEPAVLAYKEGGGS